MMGFAMGNVRKMDALNLKFPVPVYQPFLMILTGKALNMI